MRDYLAWHDDYAAPGSGLPWRLEKVRGYLRTELDRRAGPLRVVSACAGDGRDVLGVLSGRPDAARVQVTLLEVHPGLVARARESASATAAAVEVRETDAGNSDAYAGAVPADVLLVVGIFGNISDADIGRTVDLLPALCAPGALVIWSRGLTTQPDNDAIRARLVAVGAVEIDYAEHRIPDGGRTSVGAVRFAGPPRPLPAGEHLFTFVR